MITKGKAEKIFNNAWSIFIEKFLWPIGIGAPLGILTIREWTTGVFFINSLVWIYSAFWSYFLFIEIVRAGEKIMFARDIVLRPVLLSTLLVITNSVVISSSITTMLFFLGILKDEFFVISDIVRVILNIAIFFVLKKLNYIALVKVARQ